jgi:cell division protein FtsL
MKVFVVDMLEADGIHESGNAVQIYLLITIIGCCILMVLVNYQRAKCEREY